MSKETTSKKPKIHRQKTFDLCLTKHELLHVRDMMSIILPPNGEKTISQNLAELEDRTLIETMLWEKISKLCSAANLPLGNEAPDYVVAPNGPPPMAVFHINHDLEQSVPSEPGGFLPDSQEADCSDEDEDDEED